MADLALRRLVGQRVSVVERVHDYVQLRFSNGDLLNVYNDFSLSGATGGDLATLANCVVEDVQADDRFLTFVFSEKSLQVGLVDAAYRGPEAIEYIAADGGRIVWS